MVRTDYLRSRVMVARDEHHQLQLVSWFERILGSQIGYNWERMASRQRSIDAYLKFKVNRTFTTRQFAWLYELRGNVIWFCQRERVSFPEWPLSVISKFRKHGFKL